jgi:hypothetical protein
MRKLKNNKYTTCIDNIIDGVNDTTPNDTNNSNINNIENTKIFITHKKKIKNTFDDTNELFNVDYIFLNKNDDTNANNDNNNNKNNNKNNENNNRYSDSNSNSNSNSEIKKIKTTLKRINSKSSKCKSSGLSSPDNKDIYEKIEDKNIFFNELLKKQIVGIPSDKKLNYNDVKRISKYIKSSIFDKKICSIWNGYITNEKNNLKGTYINFYFNKKKIALHRLLYINYIGVLTDDEYLKFTCENKGKCCNINHMKKHTYNNTKINSEKDNNNCDKNDTCDKNSNSETILKNKSTKNKSTNNDLSESIQINVDKKKLIVEI